MKDKADRIFAYISEHISVFGYPPTVREICAELDIRSTSTVHRYLKELEAEGRITMGENQNRAITVNHFSERPEGTIPVLGRVAAGSPILANEEVEEYIPYSGNPEGVFALRVRHCCCAPDQRSAQRRNCGCPCGRFSNGKALL